jgi:hypothetical protein
MHCLVEIISWTSLAAVCFVCTTSGVIQIAGLSVDVTTLVPASTALEAQAARRRAKRRERNTVRSCALVFMC